MIEIITKNIARLGGLIVGKAGTGFFSAAGAPTNGASGTLQGIAGPGSRYVNETTGDAYVNVNTKASPTWQLVPSGAAGTILSAAMEAALVRYAEVTLTNAQVLNLRATPITMLAAPGAGKRSEFLAATLNVDGTAGAYTESAANLGFKYVDGSGVQIAETVEATGFIDQAGKMHTHARPKLDAIATEAQSVNKVIVLHNLGAGEYGGGNVANSLKVSLLYRIVTTL